MLVGIASEEESTNDSESEHIGRGPLLERQMPLANQTTADALHHDA